MNKRLPLPTGTVLQNRYRIARQLGAGGFGAVYEAVDDEIGKSFALKETFYADNEELRDAFKREARMLAGLSHDAFPHVSHYFTENDGYFLVMELIDGEDLDKLLLKRGAPFEPEQVLDWADQILDALEDLHAAGIIHRDIKPANIKLTSKGRIKLLDFGIAKGGATETTVMTTIGSMAAATLQYAPLEQVLRAAPHYQSMLEVGFPDKVAETLARGTNAASDLYALGATLYQLLTKTLPPDSATRALTIWSGQTDKLRPAHTINPQIPPAVSAALQKSLELERRKRFSSAKKMREELKKAAKPIVVPAPAPFVAEVPIIPQPFKVEPNKFVPKNEIAPPSDLTQPANKSSNKMLLYAALIGLPLLFLVIGFVAYYNGTTNHYLSAKAQTLAGHYGSVYSVAFSPDGKTIASGSGDRTIRVWDAANGNLRQTLTGYEGDVHSVAFSPDGKTIASASSDWTIKIWDATNGNLQLTLIEHNKHVNSAAFSPDGKTIASASADGTIKIWDATTGNLQLTFTGHDFGANSAAFSPDGKTIASAGSDRTIKIWDATTGNLRQTLPKHDSGVRSAAFSPDGKMIVSASYDETIKVWDAASGNLQLTLTGHSDKVVSVTFSPDGKTIASASKDSTIRIWNATDGNLKLTLTGHNDEVHSVAFSPDGKTIVSGSSDNTIKLWRVE